MELGRLRLATKKGRAGSVGSALKLCCKVLLPVPNHAHHARVILARELTKRKETGPSFRSFNRLLLLLPRLAPPPILLPQ